MTAAYLEDLSKVSVRIAAPPVPRLAMGMAWAYPAPMPEPRKIAAYARDLLLIFAPLGGLIYCLAYPDAFDAFLNWGIGLFR
jgi:hypothetical protein